MSGDQLTILAVDDERTQLEDLARLLRNSPSVKEVECAYDGHDALVKASTFYVDAQARLDVADILKQIAWYKAQGLVAPEVDERSFLDLSFVKGHFNAG